MNLKLDELLTAAGPTADFVSKFKCGAKVHIDGDQSIVATVTAHMFRDDRSQLECSWVLNGDLKTHWIEEWRLSHAN